jgi:hypothetical protein
MLRGLDVGHEADDFSFRQHELREWKKREIPSIQQSFSNILVTLDHDAHVLGHGIWKMALSCSDGSLCEKRIASWAKLHQRQHKSLLGSRR